MPSSTGPADTRATKAESESQTGELTSLGPDGERLSIPDQVARRVWALSAGRCAMCNAVLLEDRQTGESVFIGQLAHIIGATAKPGSPRGQHAMSLDERRREHNLLLLCYSHHKVIDDKTLWDRYSVDDLCAIKAQHQREVRELTELRGARRSTVLRVIGGIRNQVYETSKEPVVAALRQEQRYPDWSLLDGQDFEIDLRDLPGENTSEPYYWQAVEAKLRERLAPLSKYVRDGVVTSVAVFPFARIPALTLLGSMLEDGLPIVIYPKRRDDGGGWGWPSASSSRVKFAVAQPVGADGTGGPVVLVSLSASLAKRTLPQELSGRPVYELRPADTSPSPDLLTTPSDLDSFARAWRALLADLEGAHPGEAVTRHPGSPRGSRCRDRPSPHDRNTTAASRLRPGLGDGRLQARRHH